MSDTRKGQRRSGPHGATEAATDEQVYVENVLLERITTAPDDSALTRIMIDVGEAVEVGAITETQRLRLRRAFLSRLLAVGGKA